MTQKIAIYARCSTASQDVGMQIAELTQYAVRRGCEIAGEYVDEGVSGTKESRPQLNRLMADAKLHVFDCVIVYRYDRLARSLRQLVNTLAEFDALGIQFVSIHEGVDTSTPNGRLVFGIFASIAEFERELIRDRVRSGLRNAKAKGKRLGRPPVAASRDEVLALKAAGKSYAAIAKELSISKSAAFTLARSSEAA